LSIADVSVYAERGPASNRRRSVLPFTPVTIVVRADPLVGARIEA